VIDEPIPAAGTAINGVHGTKAHGESPPQSSSVWGIAAAAPSKPNQPQVEPVPTQQRAAVNGAPPAKPTFTTTPTTVAPMTTRRVDPTAKMSWASIVKPTPPPPAPKPAPPPTAPKAAAPPPVAPVVQPEPPAASAPQTTAAGSRPSTRGQDVIEEPAQTIHDPFVASGESSSKPKVQLPTQPVLPYIPSLISQQSPAAKEPATSVPSAPEPMTPRTLHLLEDQQSPVPEPPTTSVTAHRASAAPGTKTTEPPPGLGSGPRIARPTRENPVIMPTMASQSLSGLPVQFGFQTDILVQF